MYDPMASAQHVIQPVCAPNPPGESLADSLSGESLHLDVEELSEVTEPLNHLGGHAAVELDRKTAGDGSEHVGTGKRSAHQVIITETVLMSHNGKVWITW